MHHLPLTPSSPWMLPLRDWMGSHPYKEDAKLELSLDLHRAARIQYRILHSSTGLVSTVMAPNTHPNSHSIANTILYTNILANLMMPRNLYFFLNYECFWEYIQFFLLHCANRNCCNLLQHQHFMVLFILQRSKGSLTDRVQSGLFYKQLCH